MRRIKSRFAKALPAVLDDLRDQLAVYFDQQAVGEPVAVESMASVAAAATARHATRLARALSRVNEPSDLDAAHRARIAAKRLRYIIEPMYERGHAPECVARLRELQDQLGDARDMHLFARRLLREIGELAARDARKRALAALSVPPRPPTRRSSARLRPGLLELARRAADREREAFITFRHQWTVTNVAALVASIPRDFANPLG
jgi:CHAD domain-containing protein